MAPVQGQGLNFWLKDLDQALVGRVKPPYGTDLACDPKVAHAEILLKFC